MGGQWIDLVELALSALALGVGVWLSFRAFKVSKELTKIHTRLTEISKDQEAVRKDVDRHGEQIESLLEDSRLSRELHGQIAKDHETLGRLHGGLSEVHGEISRTHTRFGRTARPGETRRPELPQGPPG